MSKSMWGRFETYDSPREPAMIPRQIVLDMIAVRCAEGRHVEDQDDETGDFICKWCRKPL